MNDDLTKEEEEEFQECVKHLRKCGYWVSPVLERQEQMADAEEKNTTDVNIGRSEALFIRTNERFARFRIEQAEVTEMALVNATINKNRSSLHMLSVMKEMSIRKNKTASTTSTTTSTTV